MDISEATRGQHRGGTRVVALRYAIPELVIALAITLASAGAGAQSPCRLDARVQGAAPLTLTLVQARDGEGDEFDEPGGDVPVSQSDDGDEEAPQALPPATAGQPWAVQLEARGGGATLRWALLKAPRGLELVKDPPLESAGAGHRERATLRWTPAAADLADNDVRMCVASESGGTVLRSFSLAVAGGNHVPEIDGVAPAPLTEGQTLRLPITAADADGDALTLAVRNLPRGARYDAARGLFIWTPGYGQAGEYQNITIKASDGKHSAEQRFDLTVKPGRRKPAAATPQPAPALKAHAGFTLSHELDPLDGEGHAQFWRVLAATHGAARMAGDGITLLFTPEAGYAGPASVTVQPDNGQARAEPLTLGVNVSAARLLAIRLAPDLLAPQRIGATLAVRAIADFEDETDVPLDEPGGALRLETADLAGMGYVGTQAVKIDDATGRVRFVAPGPALLVATWQDADGRALRAVAALTAITGKEGRWPPAIQPVHVYPAAFALPPGGARQLKVQGDDLNSGGFIDLHAARQTVFEGKPARVEEFEDPETGEITSYPYDAVSPVHSGTRYFSGDERIATVSADGLVTAHAPGKVTIDVVHLRSMSFEHGIILRQIAGQQSVALTVAPAQVLDGAAAIAVRPAEGGVIAAPTGETVMAGPGALAQDTAVGIRRLALADLERVAGLAAPAPGVLQALGAFHLDAGEQPSAAPLQLAVPVQDGIAAQPGDEALFLRKGRVMVEGGGSRDTWWLVDSGIVGADGVARTASLPGEGLNLPDGISFRSSQSYNVGALYGGVTWPGDYVVMRRAPGVAGKLMSVVIERGDWLDFGAMNLSLAGGMTGALINSETLGALATAASDLRAGSYHFEVAQFARIALSPGSTGESLALNVSRQLPAIVRPWGKVRHPKFAKAPDAVSYDEASGTVNIKLIPDDPGRLPGTVVVRTVSSLSDGGKREIARFDGATVGDTLRITPPPDLALADTRWQLTRQISLKGIDNSGELRRTIGAREDALEFGNDIVRLEFTKSAPALIAALTCAGVQFTRGNKVVGEVQLLDGPPPDGCLAAAKAQPLALSPAPGGALYVAGAGVVYAIDMVSLKRIDTIAIAGGGPITSLLATDNLLFIGQGDGPAGAGGFRLLAMFSTSQSSRYHRDPIALKLPRPAAAPLRVDGMDMGADGRTLVMAVSGPPEGGAAASGQVWVLDLDSLNLKTGDIAAPLAAPGGDLAAPLEISAARGNPDRYLVSSPNGRQAILQLTRNGSRQVTQAALAGVDARQPETAADVAHLENAINADKSDYIALTVPDGIPFAAYKKDAPRSISTYVCGPCLQGRCPCKR